MHRRTMLSINYLKRVHGLRGSQGNEEDQAAAKNMSAARSEKIRLNVCKWHSLVNKVTSWVVGFFFFQSHLGEFPRFAIKEILEESFLGQRFKLYILQLESTFAGEWLSLTVILTTTPAH